MAQVDFAERQLTLKLVYYGPPLSGKTSNLRALHGAVDKVIRGRLLTLDTRDDRTLFFDLLPIFFRASGFSFQIKVYTVPGQITLTRTPLGPRSLAALLTRLIAPALAAP